MRIDPIRIAIIIGLGAAFWFALETQYNPELANTIVLGYAILSYKFYEFLGDKNIGRTAAA